MTTWVVAYWANYATIGLAAAASRDPQAASMGWSWLAWYAAHQDPDTGYVSDYRVVNGRSVSLRTRDSTDAYAATFLMAVDALYVATGCLLCVTGL